MRIAILALLLAACSDETPSAVDASMCATACPPCASDELCLASGYVQPTCLKMCTTSADCTDGLVCRYYDFSTPARSIGTYACGSSTSPPACGGDPGVVCSDHTGTCLDEHHYGKPFIENGVCGYDIVSCPNGCAMTDGFVGPNPGSVCN